jgi:hypothetical protein
VTAPKKPGSTVNDDHIARLVFDPLPELFDDIEMRFPIAALIMGAQLWHAEPDDPVKVELLHEAITLFNASYADFRDRHDHG